ncbi:MAG: selenocysteine-specific translation elongation factor [Chloroflexi bacterium]|nr:selenocysteine-specific translation elongation factor [Chloroflexota bacterium]
MLYLNHRGIMFVIGTAGHVDHGKSALVKALTGIDPDRLAEEKERGMTIDLGFAWLTLPSKRQVSIVDVPGHERFIRNMLAGAGGVDLALFVVAADEGVMPQTKEHLSILDILHVKGGIVALTKKDLVDNDWLSLVTSDVKALLEGTTLEKAPIVPVSSVTGEGLAQLLEVIDGELDSTQPRHDLGRPRLPIDRVFTLAGFGTVVTGTLVDGHLSLGQEVEIVPQGIRSRIRGLQTHRQKIGEAVPGSRVAANIAGVAPEEIQRGNILTLPGLLKPTIAIDVVLRLIKDSPSTLSHNAMVTFHAGTQETPARIRLLDRGELGPGESAWAQIRTEQPVCVVKGDFFVIRSTKGTIGGGEVVETHAKRHKRFHAQTLERLAVLEKGTPEEILLKALETSEPCEMNALVKRVTFPEGEIRSIVVDLASKGSVIPLGGKTLERGTLLYSFRGWTRLVEKACSALESYHLQHPLRRGAPKEELRSRLGLHPQTFSLVVQRMGEKGILAEEGATVRLPSHEIKLSREQQKAVEEFIHALEKNPYSPPTDIPLDPELLSLLVDQRRVVKVGDDVVFSAGAYDKMVKLVVEHIRAKGKITVAEVRDLLGTSRKYALALMEHLDQQRITRRVGDERVLR